MRSEGCGLLEAFLYCGCSERGEEPAMVQEAMGKAFDCSEFDINVSLV